jgi:hypothetical protein
MTAKGKQPIEEGPRLRGIEEIDMGLVDEARESRIANGGTIPVGDAATELIRLMRVNNAFGGKMKPKGSKPPIEETQE